MHLTLMALSLFCAQTEAVDAGAPVQADDGGCDLCLAPESDAGLATQPAEVPIDAGMPPRAATQVHADRPPEEKKLDPTYASFGRGSVGWASDFDARSGLATLSPNLSVSVTGHKLPSQDGSIVAASYRLALNVDAYKASNLRTSEDEKGQPTGADFRFEGALGAGLGAGEQRPCGLSLLAILALQASAQAPIASVSDSTFVGFRAAAGLDLGGQLNLACTSKGTVFNVGPTVIATGGASLSPSQGGFGISDPGVMLGGRLSIIRDADLLVELELFKRVYEFGLPLIPLSDTRGRVSLGKRLLRIFGIGLDLLVVEFTELKLRGFVSVIW